MPNDKRLKHKADAADYELAHELDERFFGNKKNKRPDNTGTKPVADKKPFGTIVDLGVRKRKPPEGVCQAAVGKS